MKNPIKPVAVKRIITIFVFTYIFLFSSCAPKDENNVAVKESTVTSSEEFTDSQKKEVVIPEPNTAVEEPAVISSEESIDSQETDTVIPEPYVVEEEAIEDQSISFEDFGEMDYALFLETNVGYGVTADYFKYGIYGDFVNTVREGEEVYFQLCRTMLGTEISWKTHKDWADNMEILHIQNLSPDLQWIVARQYLMRACLGYYKDEVVYDGDIIAEVESSCDVTDTYFYLKRTEQGTYEPVSDALFEKRKQLVDELGGYTNACHLEDVTCLDEYGKYLAIAAPDSQSIGIYSTEDWGLKQYISMGHIDVEYPLAISQFVGDESSGWLVFSNGGSTYRLDYPDGKPEKIGEFMFDTTYSPDGKYLAYCTGNMEFHEFSKMLDGDKQKLEKIGKLYHEWNKILPGWYIKEIETGNTTYIPIATWEQDDRPLYGGRCIWIEKDKLSEILDL
ncbi:MAG: hypothetical protein K2O32_15015 [Acetatifactor sp.]|nr:hypothetical protein [Acetatifactor sp.]